MINDIKNTQMHNNTLVLNNRYTIGKQVGTGGLSVVFDAYDNYSRHYNDFRKLAIKIPYEQLLRNEDIDAFLYAEYSSLISLSHKNIVKAIDFGIDQTTQIPYIVLEFLDGELLSQKNSYQLPKVKKMLLTKMLFETIKYIHSLGIIHADINPTNIMCLNNGDFKLFDFGISIDNSRNKNFQIDYSKVKAYNPIYAAPEVILGQAPTKHSDIFSLAVIIFEIYNGYLPYKKSSLELNERQPSLMSFLQIPLGIRFWILNALNYNQKKRSILLPNF
ncbi:serine/threonine-protein kinase [Arcobacter sp. FWKO B]|uniref:serine/threonine-protein kinase n=1 Tax=Arcobacter sp. FWKO B TaxID=2593672 RepID=UPI0018A4841D|nr:serine/threonine-protein kinase [Arcobacter sp. FWKO B]QOG13204.1 serine/threonine protein kinase [Arcobacter sp. FWKO B]